MKKCIKCLEEKDFNCFYKHKRSKDKLDYYCKKCKDSFRIKNKKCLFCNKSFKSKIGRFCSIKHSFNYSFVEKGEAIFNGEILTHKKCKDCLILKELSSMSKKNSNVCKTCSKIKREISKNKEKIFIREKKCQECNLVKKFDLFPSNKLSIDGRRNICKECANIKRNIYINFNIEAKIAQRLRNRIRDYLKLKNRSYRTIDLLGCNIQFFKDYLESKFKDNMNWEEFNLGKIHIDHIKPCCSFDLTKEEEQKKCFHYTNLQPLWAKENLEKGSKIYE